MLLQEDYNKKPNECKKNSTPLEPRLLEYLKKVKFYKKNNITYLPEIMQKEFAITKNDIKNIKLYIQGKPLCCDNDFCHDMISTKGQKFPSHELRDERMKRLQNKQQKDKDAMTQRGNYTTISSNYDMYESNFSSPASDGFVINTEWNDIKNITEYNPNIAKRVIRKGTGCFAESNTYDQNPKSMLHTNIKTKHVSPSISFNNPLSFSNNNKLKEGDYSVDSMFSQLDTYKKRPGINNFIYRKDQSDYVDKYLPMAGYNKNTYMNKGGKNIDMETEIKFGQGTMRGGKSLGYPTTIEHSFDYISKDIQHPDHVVSERPQSTRLLNKDFARPVSRDMMC
jgi:hypothetical protein